MKPSSLTITVPPFSTAFTCVISAAGFMATSTLGWSPGVRMSREAKWIWKAETPCGVPAGARISAGKSGSVARSLPTTAVASVKRLPVELHAVARVAGEANDYAVDRLESLLVHARAANSGPATSVPPARPAAGSQGWRSWPS